jgi:hypothetical protein
VVEMPVRKQYFQTSPIGELCQICPDIHIGRRLCDSLNATAGNTASEAAFPIQLEIHPTLAGLRCTCFAVLVLFYVVMGEVMTLIVSDTCANRQD